MLLSTSRRNRPSPYKRNDLTFVRPRTKPLAFHQLFHLFAFVGLYFVVIGNSLAYPNPPCQEPFSIFSQIQLPSGVLLFSAMAFCSKPTNICKSLAFTSETAQ